MEYNELRLMVKRNHSMSITFSQTPDCLHNEIRAACGLLRAADPGHIPDSRHNRPGHTVAADVPFKADSAHVRSVLNDAGRCEVASAEPNDFRRRPHRNAFISQQRTSSGDACLTSCIRLSRAERNEVAK